MLNVATLPSRSKFALTANGTGTALFAGAIAVVELAESAPDGANR